MFSKAIFSLFFLPLALSQVPLQDFFPFGTANGDITVPQGDDTFVNVNLSPGHTFNFFNTAYNNVFVNINGALSFLKGITQYTPTCAPMGEPMIIPYWADVDTRLGGDVFYRETTDSAVLNKVADELQRIYPGSIRANMQWAFITTWSEVPFFGAQAAVAATGCNGLNLRNTFQTILTSDGTKSYSMFFYNKIQWTAGTASGSDCNGAGGTPAKAEFDAGDGISRTIPGSCSPDVVRITDTTNVDEPGKWVFQVDRELEAPPEIEEETSEAVPEQTSEAVPEDQSSTSYYPDLTSPEPISGECDPFNCARYGFCYDYTFCNKQTSQWENLTCSEGLYWNPEANGGLTTEGQGSCDIWDNLSPLTKDSYRNDGQCFPLCHYQEITKCSANYLFHEKHRDARMQRTMNCPVDTRQGRYIPLVWVQERETCDFCYNAVDGSGNQCCARYDAGNDEQYLRASTSSPFFDYSSNQDQSSTPDYWSNQDQSATSDYWSNQDQSSTPDYWSNRDQSSTPDYWSNQDQSSTPDYWSNRDQSSTSNYWSNRDQSSTSNYWSYPDQSSTSNYWSYPGQSSTPGYQSWATG